MILCVCVCVCVSTVRPIQVQIGEGQQLCAVCSDVGNGIHFGVITCEGCKVCIYSAVQFSDEKVMLMTAIWGQSEALLRNSGGHCTQRQRR